MAPKKEIKPKSRKRKKCEPIEEWNPKSWKKEISPAYKFIMENGLMPEIRKAMGWEEKN